MKILVIGGAGYIGSHVARCLLDAGHEITVLDNLSTGCRENLFPEASFIEGDILDTRLLADTMEKGFDGMVHLAAFKAAGESMLRPGKYSVNNISGTINILNAAVETGIRFIVFSSSAAVYGEPRYLPIDEKHPVEPENYYGFTKLEIERFLSWYDKLKEIKYASLRYFNAAGYDKEGRITGLERKPANLLPVIMEVAAGKREKLQVFGDDYPTRDGTGVRDYIHVTDLAVAHLQSMEYIRKHNSSITVNLGSEQGLSVLEIVDSAREITGRELREEITERRRVGTAELVASSAEARRLLSWKAEFSDVETLVVTSWDRYKPQFK